MTTGLVAKMMDLNFPKYLCKLVKSFLTQRSFFVKVGSSISSNFQIVAGVPQGSAISPFLYSVYTCDITVPRDCDLGQYADDTALTTIGLKAGAMVNRLEAGLRKLDRYFHKWRIKINPAKTEAIFFTKRRKDHFLPSRKISLHGTLIDWKDSVRYLGIFLDKRLTMKTHINELIKKSETLIKTLYSLIGRGSRLRASNKLLLFKQIFRPTLTFGTSHISRSAKTHRKKLQTAQNKILKIMLQLPMRTATVEVHEVAGVETIDTFVNRLSTAFEARSRYVCNPEVERLFQP